MHALSLGVISLWLFSKSSLELALPRPCVDGVLCVVWNCSQTGVDSPSLRKTPQTTSSVLVPHGVHLLSTYAPERIVFQSISFDTN